MARSTQSLKQENDQIINAYCREYDTLREESLLSMENRTQIIAFGLGTIGVLIGGTLTLGNHLTNIVIFMSNCAIPFIAVLVYYAWFAEFERMVRAGKYLQCIEKEINVLLPRPVLSWEQNLESMRMKYAYVIVAILFLGIAAGSPFMIHFIPASDGQYQGIQFRLCPLSFDLLLKSPYLTWALILFSTLHTGYRFIFLFNKYGKVLNSPETRISSHGAVPTPSEKDVDD